jgi:D-alanyl-lipoteichoic acid acyltransferase DltB (MBOAT superfamily)
MVPLLRLLTPFVIFPAASWAVFRLSPRTLKLPLFAVVNILGAMGLCLLAPLSGLFFWQLPAHLRVALPVFALYLATVVVHYVLTRLYARRSGWIPWAAFFFPLVVMVVVKYVPAVSAPFRESLAFIDKRSIVEFFVGISYMAFRLSYLVLEIRNGVVEMPSLWEHLSFAFFVPTFTIGPISRYSVFHRSLYFPDRKRTPVRRSLMRMLVGATKYLFLASMIEQLSYSGLLRDGHLHAMIDLPVAAVAFYLYLYLNFSGYCDMAIGAGGLIAIDVDENFDFPFRARNLQEYWTRWHITLSRYMQETVFSPLSKVLIRRFGPQSAPHSIAVAIMAVFIGIGAWHGLTWNYILFGVIHGCGVVGVNYYNIWLKKRLGKSGYAAYHRNPWILAAARTATFLYAAGALFFFANSLDAARAIMGVLR